MSWVPTDLISFADAAKLFPASGPRRHSVSIPTIARWATNGKRGIRLQVVRLGRQKFTTARWLAEFLEAVNPNPNPQPQVPLTRDVENDIARARALTRRTS